MALPVKNFHGKIDGNNIKTYKHKIDYSVKTLEGRLDKVREILNIEIIDGIEFSRDEFWNVIFDQTFDEKLSKDGAYYVEELNELLPYNDFIKWCKKNEVDPVEYLEVTNPFDDLDGGGRWEYTCQNTSKIKLVLTSSDGLYSDTNVCEVLTEMCEYILKKTKRHKSTRYYFYTEKELKRAEEDDEEINKKFQIADENGMMLFLKDSSVNYKFEKKQEIDVSDERYIEDFETPYLKDYVNALKSGTEKLSILTRCDKLFNEIVRRESNDEDYSMVDLMIKYKLEEDDFETYNNWYKRRQMLIRLCESIPSDAVLTKDAMRGTIYFKSPLRDEGCPDWDMIDMFDKEHVKALIGIKRGNNLQDDLSCIVMDLRELIDRTSLTDRQREILELWKEDKSQTEIGDILGINQSNVHSAMDKIANNVVKKYEEDYEEWYYLNISKGKYKTCSKCGEVKLLQRFDKKRSNKDGYKSNCKKCN